VIPASYSLSQNYPNPFTCRQGERNLRTTIKFGLPNTSKVLLSIYNIKGQKVCELVNDTREAGYHSVDWNGLDSFGNEVSAGLYFYQLNTSETSLNRKMLIIK
jgi:flagellar hook assembly protein FlgD